MQLANFPYRPLIGVAALVCAALIPAGASAATAGSPASQARSARPATAYVVSDSGTVTPIRTAANTAGKPIKVGSYPRAIAITR
jgi:DNA-binding beta-propeller fold protein YncE